MYPRQKQRKAKRTESILCYLSRERTAAAATTRRIGILENETLAHQRIFVVERRAVQIKKTLGIDEDARAVFLKNFVAVAGLRIEAHRIGQPGAAAALHAHAKAALLRGHTFFLEQRADFSCGALTQVDFRNVGAGYFCRHD